MSLYKQGKYIELLKKRIGIDSLDECEYFPKYFTIETCNNCNARCIMCPKGLKGTTTLEIMSEELFDKIVSEIKNYNEWIEMICLNSDGEPTLDKLLPDRIKKLKDIGIKKVNISTNGQLLTEKLGTELIKSGLDDIRISIDAFYEETYKKIRKGLDYKKIVENIKRLIEIRNKENSNMEIRIRMIELEENKNEREEWSSYWKNLTGLNDKVQIMPKHSWSGVIEEEEKEDILFYADKPCISVFSSMAVNFDGKVQLCDSDIEQSMIIGNVRIQSIKEIWNSKEFQKIRRLHIEEKRNKIKICQGCDHWSREFKQIKE